MPVTLTDCSYGTQHLPGDETDYPSIYLFRAAQDNSGVVVKIERVTETNAYGWCIAVLGRRGSPLSALVTNDIPSYGINVRSANLNQDNKPDFLVNIWTGGCGLAGQGSMTTFLLSDGERYVATSFYSYDFGPEDIVRFATNGPCYFISNDLIGNGEEKTKDGRDHNFWVYQLYRFDGSQMILANVDDPRFPKWVWYTFKENHKETDQLTKDQKQRILGER